MKKRIKKSIIALAAIAMAGNNTSHAAVLLAGFYDSGTDATVTGLAANTTFADITATFDGRGRLTTANIGSTDGSLSALRPCGAPTALPTESPLIGVYRSNVDNTFTLTNNTTSNVSVETIAFDVHNNDNPSRDCFDILNLIYLTGDLTGIADNTTLNTWTEIPRHTGTISLNGEIGRILISHLRLGDYTLAPGQSASFRIISASTDTALPNNQNFGALDNIGFIGAVPEPRAALLGGLGLLALLRRRR